MMLFTMNIGKPSENLEALLFRLALEFAVCKTFCKGRNLFHSSY